MLDRPQVSDDAGIDLALFIALLAKWDFPHQIPAAGADTERRGDCKIRQPVPLADHFDDLLEAFRIVDFLPDEKVQDRPSGIFDLQIILMIQDFKHIIGIIDRQMS